jgi:hypothetical protein
LFSFVEAFLLARPATTALLDEFDAMGHTDEAMPELQTIAAPYPEDDHLWKAVRDMASSIIAKCTGGHRASLAGIKEHFRV